MKIEHDQRPAGRRQDEEDARRRRKAALDHPVVNATLEILEGEILEIRPLGSGGGSQ